MYPIYTAQNVHFGWNEKVIGFVQSLKYYDSIVKKEAEKEAMEDNPFAALLGNMKFDNK